MASDPTTTAAGRPCLSCGRPRAECRTPVDLFLSCCHTCAVDDGDTHREPVSAASGEWEYGLRTGTGTVLTVIGGTKIRDEADARSVMVTEAEQALYTVVRRWVGEWVAIGE